MCGFAGTSFGLSPGTTSVDQFISYRGTIQGGWYGQDLQIIARRLPRTGDRRRPQPVATEGGSVLAFNGQVYNTKWMTERLGLKCEHGTVDSEILALWLEDRGKKGLTDIEGEYALAFFDRKRSQLILARDAMGTRPLFWGRAGRKVSFSSSARATGVLLHGAASVDAENAHDCLWYGVPPSGSCFRGVRSVKAGSAVVCDPNASEVLTVRNRVGKRAIDLVAAVARRVPADGACLAWSGGIDSELVRKMWPADRACKTAHVTSAEKSRASSADILVQIKPETLKEALSQFAKFAERPVTSLSGPAMLVLATAAEESGSEVWLSGEGADEIFAGYPHYFVDSVGHPFLVAKQRSKDFVEYALGLKAERLPSEPIRAMLTSTSPKEWLAFDRRVRLPEHLCPMNGDIPTMMAKIESRSPYLDLWDRSDDRLPVSPKQVLKDMGNAHGLVTAPKEGLFFPSSILGARWLMHAAKAVENADVGMMCVPSDFSIRVEKVFGKLESLRLPSSVADPLVEAVTGLIMGLWSFLFSCCSTRADEALKSHTLVSVSHGRILSEERLLPAGFVKV